MNASAHPYPRTTASVAAPAGARSPFTERYRRRLPRGFADEAAGMDWRTMVDTFAPSSDHFHLADFSRRPLGRGITAYEAILATRGPEDAPGDFTTRRLTTSSCGDLTAMSEMLGRVGARVEIERFHQYEGHRHEGTTFAGNTSWCTILRATTSCAHSTGRASENLSFLISAGCTSGSGRSSSGSAFQNSRRSVAAATGTPGWRRTDSGRVIPA